MKRHLLCRPFRLATLAAACVWLSAAWPGPQPLVVRLDPLPAPAPAEIFLRANQVGYGPGDAKVGVVFSTAALPDPTFTVVDAATGAAVHEGKARVLPGEHWGAFQHSFHRLRELIEEVGSGEDGSRAPASIVLLSGDVHHAYLAEVAFKLDNTSSSYQARLFVELQPAITAARNEITSAMASVQKVLTAEQWQRVPEQIRNPLQRGGRRQAQ